MPLRKLAVILAAGIVAGCAEDAAPTTNEARSAAVVSREELSVGDPVGHLSVPLLLQADGLESVSLQQLRGSTVVLEFWATWCAPCVAVMDHLNEVANEFRHESDVKFISITAESADTVRGFLQRKSMDTWIGLDPDRKLHRAFGVQTIPQSILINSRGELAGFISPTQLNAKLIRGVQDGALIDTNASRSILVAGRDPSSDTSKPPLMQFVLRESAVNSTGGSFAVSGTAWTILGESPEVLISQVFGLQSTRTVFDVDFPDQRFDLIAKFPGSPRDAKRLLRSALASAFEVKTRQEERQVDLLVLNTSSDGKHALTPTVSTGGSSMSANQTEIIVVNGSPANAIPTLESKLDCPIIDETNLGQEYDFSVRWQADAPAEEIADAFTAATGLQLTREQRAIEFTVVERR
ncbi:MAG: TIGR03435 family protein [Planctomycetota bacterium]